METTSAFGFTLLELLITLALMTIGLTIGVPSLLEILVEHRVNNAIIQLNQSIILARTLAIQKEESIIICPLTASGRCETNWKQGYSIFIDKNDDRKYQEKIDTLISRSQHINNKDRLTYSGGRMLKFNPLGHLSGRAGTFRYCPLADSESVYARAIVVSLSGRPRQSADIDGDGKDELAGANDHIRCLE
ncbi:GspH/FimT family protein [Gayadomonas joobiniege]|uniref:GspH/FimT family protein n=1 Tax=Gayadomonas joobiniege TaxID=1234606 RepID=UPI00035CD94E|nr:GspH/FimT family pseudopilin [Gayadomonas joobiniege]